jgi:hypothetical protein
VLIFFETLKKSSLSLIFALNLNTSFLKKTLVHFLVTHGYIPGRLAMCLLVLVFFLPNLHSYAQDVVLETNHPSLRWSQVNTRYFRVIFPEGFDEQGQRVANTLEHIHQAEARTLGSYPRLITVILQNQSSISNGFVSFLPRRSEFYTMPAQDYNFLGTNDWLDLLASHEYRHIVQYQHATRGFSKIMYYLFGANTMATMAHAAVPSWFWEGDAVATETAFTRSGRGKIPNFSLLLKTNLMEGRTFNYHKQYLRSYKHNISDHYVLGYHMVSYLRKKTNDPEIWGKISGRAWNVPFIPFTFSFAIKSKAGMSVSRLYRDMAKDLKQSWQEQIDTLKFTPSTALRVNRRGYTDYNFPRQMADGSVFALKEGIGNISEFVSLGREEKSLFIPGFMNNAGYLSVQGSTIVWTEYGYDPRWAVRNYSLIKTYDLKTKNVSVIGGKKARYTAASISPDQTKIAAIETDTDYKTKLVILSYPEGEILNSIANPENHFYSMPQWSFDGKKIVALKTTRQGKTIVIIDAGTTAEQQVLPFSDENVGYPSLHQQYLLFNSPATGIDNIFVLDVNSGLRFKITTSRYGAYNPSISPDGKTIWYNEQTRDGLDVVRIPFDPKSWKRFEPGLPENSSYQHLIDQEAHPRMLDQVPQHSLPVTRYRKGNGVFNPYTWGFFFDNTLTQGNFGISSQDLLSTTLIQFGYNFDINERTSSLQAGISYQGLYPIIDVNGSLSNRSVDELTEAGTVNFQWKEQKVDAGLRVPLITTSSRYAGSITIGNKVSLTKVTDFRNSFDNGGRQIPDLPDFFYYDYVDNGMLVANEVNLSAFRLLKRSRRDINSKWGQRFDARYFSTPFGGDFSGRLLAVTGRLYLPGIFRHHSLWGHASVQESLENRNADSYVFQNQIPLPRGHSVARFSTFYSASANYTMPLWYPDIALGPFLNFQRLRTNVFFDYGLGIFMPGDIQRLYTSGGVEARLDINVMRFLPQFDIGVRYSYGFTPAVTRFEILLGAINL